MDNSHNIAKLVNNFGKREKCIIGICDATSLRLDTTCFTPFVSRNHLKRTNPTANLPGAKSIIVVGVESKIDNFPPMPDGAGILSTLGVVDDYHIIVNSLLKRLAKELQLHTNFMYKILVDSPTLDERALAVRAGLGFFGRNGLVISPEYGSRFNIGLLLTDIEIAGKAKEVVAHTKNGKAGACPPGCNNCITACPSGALSESGGLDASRCISYLTQKDNLTPEEANIIGRHLYGCDVCQDACPLNSPGATAWANPNDWLNMSDADFAKTYGHTAMLWRGAGLLRRNARYVNINVKPSP